MASHNSDQLMLELFNPPSSQVKGDAYPSDVLDVEARDHNTDSVMVVSGDNADQGADNSDSYSDSWESATDSSPDSATGDSCLSYLDTKEVIIKSTCKRFHKKAWASCSPAKQGLWSDAQLE